MARPAINVRATGPYFTRRDRILRRGAERIVKRLVELGDERLAERLRRRPAGVFLSAAEARPGKASVGHYRRNINARASGLSGRIDDGDVEYGPWLEGVGSRNATTRFKGYHQFRKTAGFLEEQKRKVGRREARRIMGDLNAF